MKPNFIDPDMTHSSADIVAQAAAQRGPQFIGQARGHRAARLYLYSYSGTCMWMGRMSSRSLKIEYSSAAPDW